jgi:hypothetical protein
VLLNFEMLDLQHGTVQLALRVSECLWLVAVVAVLVVTQVVAVVAV